MASSCAPLWWMPFLFNPQSIPADALTIGFLSVRWCLSVCVCVCAQHLKKSLKKQWSTSNFSFFFFSVINGGTTTKHLLRVCIFFWYDDFPPTLMMIRPPWRTGRDRREKNEKVKGQTPVIYLVWIRNYLFFYYYLPTHNDLVRRVDNGSSIVPVST